MKILHILNDGPSQMADQIISVQSRDNDVKIIDLSKNELSYEAVVDEIFSYEKVISW